MNFYKLILYFIIMFFVGLRYVHPSHVEMETNAELYSNDSIVQELSLTNDTRDFYYQKNDFAAEFLCMCPCEMLDLTQPISNINPNVFETPSLEILQTTPSNDSDVQDENKETEHRSENAPSITSLKPANQGSEQFLPFETDIDRLFSSEAKKYKNLLSIEEERQISQERNQLFSTSSLSQQDFIHLEHCINLCLDVECEFNIQEHLFLRTDISDFYARVANKRHLANLELYDNGDLQSRLERYIRIANLCFAGEMRDFGVFSKNVIDMLEHDLINLILYLRRNEMYPESYNIKTYFNRYKTLLTVNSAMDTW